MITDLGPGMIATPDARATAVGQDVLDRGGSAADAVVAASAMLCVVYPQNVTLGGDTWTLVGSAGTVPVAVNGTGRAPAALSAERLRQLGFDTVPAPARTRSPCRVWCRPGVSCTGVGGGCRSPS